MTAVLLNVKKQEVKKCVNVRKVALFVWNNTVQK